MKFNMKSAVAFVAILHITIATTANLIGGDSLASELNRLAEAVGTKYAQDEYDKMDYTETEVDGQKVTQNVAGNMNQKFQIIEDALKKTKTALEETYGHFVSTSQVRGCCDGGSVFTYDTKLRENVDFKDYCVVTSKISSKEKKYPPAGDLNKILDTMKANHNDNPSLLWQYVGLESGVFINYPSTLMTSCSTYDPRYRPFYVSSATPNPKDVVIVFDTSSSMSGAKLQAARQACITVLEILNINDRVGIVAFNDEAETPESENQNCYRNELAQVTKTSKTYLKNFINSRRPNGNSNYGKSLRTAFSYFNSSENTRDRFLLFVTDGENSPGAENPLQVIKEENEKLRNNVVIHTFAVGLVMSVTAKSVLRNMSLQTMNNESYGEVKAGHFDDVGENVAFLQEKMGSFYSYTDIPISTKPVYTTPYNDFFSNIGLFISACLSASHNGVFIGVVCTDIKLSDLTSDITYLQEGEKSYGFIIDKYERTLVHPLLPDPRDGNASEYEISNIYNFEVSGDVRSVIQSMKIGNTGSKNLRTTIVESRGQKLFDGDLNRQLDAVYNWSPINGSPYFLCVVIAKNGKITRLQDRSSSGDDFLYHRWDLSDWPSSNCKHYARYATKDHTTIKLTPDAFQNPYDYIDTKETEGKVKRYADYINEKISTNPGLKISAVNSIRASKFMEDFWKRSFPEVTYLVWRYIMSEDGVARIFPGVRLTDDYDHKLRPWYRRSLSQKNVNVISAPYEDSWGSGIVISLTKTIYKGRKGGNHLPDDSIEAVIGTDFSIFYFDQMVKHKYPICENASYRCILMDNSGFLVMHPFFMETDTIPKYPIHIVNKEGRIARSLINSNIMYLQPCRDTETKKEQFTYRVSLSNLQLDGINRMSEEGYEFRPVKGSNLFLILMKKESNTQSDKCCSDTNSAKSPKSVQCSQDTCRCLCYNALPFNDCTNQYKITESQTPCSPDLPSVDSVSESENQKIQSLQTCFKFDCSCRKTEQDCFSVSGCSWCTTTRKGELLKEKSFCDYKDICPMRRCVNQDCASNCRRKHTESQSSSVTEIIVPVVCISVVIVIVIIIILVYCHRRQHKPDEDDTYMTPIPEKEEIKEEKKQRKLYGIENDQAPTPESLDDGYIGMEET